MYARLPKAPLASSPLRAYSRTTPTCAAKQRRACTKAAEATIKPVATEPLQALLEQAFPDATELAVVDRTGGGDHLQVSVASPRFEGLSLVHQARLVYAALAAPLADGSIHDLRSKTKGTP